ncbi:hypothetical protein CVT25_004630, partial [Psilocybe cyanescens]
MPAAPELEPEPEALLPHMRQSRSSSSALSYASSTSSASSSSSSSSSPPLFVMFRSLDLRSSSSPAAFESSADTPLPATIT